ncbi:MAG: hypothetical protein FJ011_22500 [Chloroflexi bacterium]|nr:hypothetical protein [Chloroflexota bacterium]
MAVVEAKRTSTDPRLAQAQAEFYVSEIAKWQSFQRDPANQVSLVRQCRQWVWECADYAFHPERFPLTD